MGNSLAGLPGMVYFSARTSPIHWQPWTKESQGMARESRRLILAVIAMPQERAHARALAELAADPAVVEKINSGYVPVLVDGDAVREMGILTATLCAEIGNGLELPLMVWLTPDCDPVAWIPLQESDKGSVVEIFDKSNDMVSNMLEDDSGYIARNSRTDQKNRAERMANRANGRVNSPDPGADCLRALRQLTSLYDPFSRTFDEAGGLFPTGAIDLLSLGARMEGLPDDLRKRSGDTLRSLLDDLLDSAMFDPLDGGVYSSKRGVTWSFPAFHRDCASQARVVVSLLDAYEATGKKKALERALGVLGFIEKTYLIEGGLFSPEGGEEGSMADFLWDYEDVRSSLGAEEFAAWVAASGMKSQGNLPPESDPTREFFRANSISFAKSAEDVAKMLGTDPISTGEAIRSAGEKLRKIRESRLKPAMGNRIGSAAATFRMVSAYATAYRITGDVSYRDRAVSTLSKARDSFSHGTRLKSYDSIAAASLIAGRAHIYGIALQAALDVSSVTLDESWALWAGDLSSTASEIFVRDDSLRECPPDADLIGLPIADLVMLFDESSFGLLAMAESRLRAKGIPLVGSFAKLVEGMPLAALDSPFLYTDVIQATMMREYGYTYVYGTEAPAEMREAIARSSLKGVNRREAESTDSEGKEPEPTAVLRNGPGKETRRVGGVGEIAVPSLP